MALLLEIQRSKRNLYEVNLEKTLKIYTRV